MGSNRSGELPVAQGTTTVRGVYTRMLCPSSLWRRLVVRHIATECFAWISGLKAMPNISAADTVTVYVLCKLTVDLHARARPAASKITDLRSLTIQSSAQAPPGSAVLRCRI
jgi:hypothetical protein